MQEEISLREIMETLWNGKFIIIGITIIAMIVAAIFSFFVIAPTYEVTSTVSLLSNSETAPQTLNSFAETIKSDSSMNRIVEKLKLDPDKHTINSVRNSIHVEAIKDTNIVRIKVEGTNPKHITMLANMVALELGARMEISDRAVRIVDSKNRLLVLEDQISLSKVELKELEVQLNKTPEKYVTRESLANEDYLRNIAAENNKLGAKEAGALSYTSETMNPLYMSLKSRIAEARISLSKMAEEKKINESDIARHETAIDTLDNQLVDENLSNGSSERMLNGFNAVFISKANEPVNPTGPNKILNVAIAAVVGIMLSVMIVFGRHYWTSTSYEVNRQSGLSV